MAGMEELSNRGLKRLNEFDEDLLGSMESLASESVAQSVILTPTLVDVLENNYVEKRDQLIGSDGSISTPLKVLKDLAFEYGVPVETVTFEVHMPRNSFGFDKVRNRVNVRVGKFTGDGEATRHRLALQLAAADLLEQLKSERGDVPEFGLLPGCRTNPQIYEDLRELCRLEALANLPMFKQVNPASLGSNNLFAFKCTIGQLETTGTSDSIFLAKRIAAKEMYEMLTSEKYPDDRIASGKGCLTVEDLKLMGITPVISTRLKQRRQMQALATNGDASGGISSEIVRRPEVGPNDIHDDDFAEEEDHVVVMRQQLDALNIQ